MFIIIFFWSQITADYLHRYQTTGLERLFREFNFATDFHETFICGTYVRDPH